MFLTSPLFLLLFRRNRPKSVLQVALCASTGLLLVFVPYCFTEGSSSSARYLFDFYPFIRVLFVLSLARMSPRVLLLGFLGNRVNFLGAAQFWAHVAIRL